MNCRDIQDRLSAYLDEELPGGETSQVQDHLKTCSKCSLALEDLRKSIALTQSIEAVDPPPWLRHKVMARVREGAGQKRGIFRKLFFPLHIKVPLEVFATIAIVFTAFYIFKTVEPEIKQPVSVTAPPVDMQETEKKAMPLQAEVRARKERRAAMPAPAGRTREAEDRTPAAGVAEEAASFPEKEAVRQEASGAADFRRKKELRSLAPSAMMKAAEADKQTTGLTVFVKDTLHVNAEIEKIIKELGGKIIRSESVDNKLYITVTLSSSNIEELKETLKLLGEVEEAPPLSSSEGDVEIAIKVVKTEVRLH